jgi:hypothetical protein
MSFEIKGARAPGEMSCRYGASRLLFRGPRKKLDKPYIAFLGGTETFGKFVRHPFVSRVEAELGLPCVNLGSVNAGLDAFVGDPDILTIAAKAKATVVQVMGAQNLSNRFYRVHPRRNDRFLAPSPLLTTIFRDVDFTEFHFNKHMLRSLQALAPERFAVVREELQMAWIGRMKLLVRDLKSKPLLLWLRYGETVSPQSDDASSGKPMLVTADMIDVLRPSVMDVIEVEVAPAHLSGELTAMQFGPLQEPAAEQMIGPDAHRQIAAKVFEALRPML